MRDEIDSRIWAEHGHAFSSDLASFFARAAAAIDNGLRRLNEIEFDAPWRSDVGDPGQA